MTGESTFFKKVGILVGGTASASLISIAALPVITRLYTAEQIGSLGLFMSLVYFWSSFQTLRYDSAFFITKTKIELNYTIILCLICMAVTTLFMIPVYYFLVSFHIMGFGALQTNYIYATVLISFGFAGFLLFQNYNIRESNFKLISKAVIVRSLANNGVKIGLALILSSSFLGLIIAEIISAWASMNTLAFSAIKNLKITPRNFSKRKLFFVIKRHKMFATVEMPSTIVNKFNLIISTPIVAYFFGPREVGYFVLAQGIAALPNTQVAKAIGDVFNMQVSTFVRKKEHEAAKLLFYKTMEKLFLFGMLPFIGTATIAPYLAGPILGEEWKEVGVYMAILSPWLYCALIVSPLSRVLSIYKMVHYKLYYDLLSLGLLVILFLATEYYNFDMYDFLIGFTLCGSIAYLVYGLLLVKVIEKDYHNNNS